MRNELEPGLDSRVRQLAALADLGEEAVVAVLVELVREGAVLVPSPIGLASDATARLSMARFRDVVPPPGDPAPGCPAGCTAEVVAAACPVHGDRS